MLTESLIGRTLTCAETGKQFIGASDGFTTNYASNDAGEVFSDEGVHLREVRALLDRSGPFPGYLSSDGKRLTGWKGNTLGHVIDWSFCTLTRQSWVHGKDYRSVRVRDIHGREWYGRGSPGICINLRPTKD
jgi:hypothetical protein